MAFNVSKILAVFLCLLMVALPVSGNVLAQYKPQDADSQMPCHQTDGKFFDQACPETGNHSCECCQFAMPATLSFNSLTAESILYLADILQEKYLQQYFSQPQSPPFRPPRFSV